jgi:hypothetical protein
VLLVVASVCSHSQPATILPPPPPVSCATPSAELLALQQAEVERLYATLISVAKAVWKELPAVPKRPWDHILEDVRSFKPSAIDHNNLKQARHNEDGAGNQQVRPHSAATQNLNAGRGRAPM